MSISTHSKLRRLVVGSLVAVAAAAPLALGTAPAQAATSSGCTVTPLKPVFAGFNSSGVKLVRDKVSIRCSGDRSVTVDQRRYDTAPNPDKYLGHTVFKRTFHASASTTVWTLQA